MNIVILTFVLVASIVFGAYWAFVLRPELREKSALRARLARGADGPARPRRLSMFRAPRKLSQIKLLERVLTRSRGTQKLQVMLEQSGLGMTVGTLVLASVCVGGLAYAAVQSLTHLTGIAWLAAAFAAAAPYMYVRFIWRRRMLTFEEQFPEAITLIARALRAGHAFSTGVAMAAEEIPAPVGTEFRQIHERQSFGMPLPEALRQFANRTPLLDARFFVTAVLTQREAGGNLAEVLDNLAAIIRARFKVQRQVRVLSAHGRISGWVLGCLPPALALYFFITVPTHFRPLFSDRLGIQMVVGALLLQFVGVLLIRRIVRIEY